MKKIFSFLIAALFSASLWATEGTIYVTGVNMYGATWDYSTSNIRYGYDYNSSGGNKWSDVSTMDNTGKTYHTFPVYSGTLSSSTNWVNLFFYHYKDDVKVEKSDYHVTDGWIDFSGCIGKMYNGWHNDAHEWIEDPVYDNNESITIYYALDNTENYNILVNAEVSDEYTVWKSWPMDNTGKTYNGKKIYSATITDYRGGIETLQLQRLDGETWKDQVVPINDTWTAKSTYAGKMYYDGSWVDYHYDVTVSFNANGHGTAPDAQTILDGQAATEPSDPSALGWEFEGWFENAEGTGDAWDFATTLTADKELFAKWTELVGGSLTIVAGEGGEVSADETNWGSHATVLNITSDQTVPIFARPNTGYTFNTWTKTSETAGSVNTNAANGSYNAKAGIAEEVTAYFHETLSTLTTATTCAVGEPEIANPTKSVSQIGIATTATITAASVENYKLGSWSFTNCERVDNGAADATEIIVHSLGTGAAATVTANYVEDLSTTWELRGGAQFGGWTSTHKMTKQEGHATESIAYYTASISGTNLGDSNGDYQFKIVNTANEPLAWYGLEADEDQYYLKREEDRTEKTLSTSGDNIEIRQDVAAGAESYEYTIKVDFSGETPKITVSFPTAYTVTYGVGTVAGNEGDITVDPAIESGAYVLANTQVSLTSPAPKSSFSFVGWYDNADGVGDAFSTEATYAPHITANRTLYAIYEGGTVGVENNEVGAKAVKRLVNGQLVIEKNGKTFNALGAEVK